MGGSVARRSLCARRFRFQSFSMLPANEANSTTQAPASRRESHRLVSRADRPPISVFVRAAREVTTLLTASLRGTAMPKFDVRPRLCSESSKIVRHDAVGAALERTISVNAVAARRWLIRVMAARAVQLCGQRRAAPSFDGRSNTGGAHGEHRCAKGRSRAEPTRP